MSSSGPRTILWFLKKYSESVCLLYLFAACLVPNSGIASINNKEKQKDCSTIKLRKHILIGSLSIIYLTDMNSNHVLTYLPLRQSMFCFRIPPLHPHLKMCLRERVLGIDLRLGLYVLYYFIPIKLLKRPKDIKKDFNCFFSLKCVSSRIQF